MDENEEILYKMHKLHLILADELKRICEKNNIKYFMIAGTMLGAIRHQGFIPWDDDMDFGMLRCDYEKFVGCCEKDLNKKIFTLQTDRNDEYYAFNFAKLRLNGTAVYEKFSKSVNTNQGIYIDIFPIDYLYDCKIKRFIQKRVFWIARNLLWVKCGYGSDERKKRFSYRLALMTSKLFSIKFLKKVKYVSITSCKNENVFEVVTSDGNYGLKKETLKKIWLENVVQFKFEDREYPGLYYYNDYLSYFYGDYMELPPVNKRNHHGRLRVELGEYNELV